MPHPTGWYQSKDHVPMVTEGIQGLRGTFQPMSEGFIFWRPDRSLAFTFLEVTNVNTTWAREVSRPYR